MIFTQACPKTCNKCPNTPFTTTSTTTKSSCFDNLPSVCSYWKNYCYMLQNQNPHPCKLTCKLC